MSNTVQHFAINADDLDRARAFYENVFGWSFQAWGPPGFLQINSGDPKAPGIRGALQHVGRVPPRQEGVRRELAVGVSEGSAHSVSTVVATVSDCARC